eukprot:539246-Lingulodinium_polyedra.AAC.1
MGASRRAEGRPSSGGAAPPGGWGLAGRTRAAPTGAPGSTPSSASRRLERGARRRGGLPPRPARSAGAPPSLLPLAPVRYRTEAPSSGGRQVPRCLPGGPGARTRPCRSQA